MKRILLASTVLAVTLASTAAQDGVDSASQRVAHAAAHMDRLELRLPGDGNVIPRCKKPLLIFGDSARQNTNGTLWAFGVQGRPLAFLELYQGAQEQAPWVHAVTLTGTDRVVLSTPGSGTWRPGTLQIELTPVPAAPTPRSRETQRLRQMKDIARRFDAHEFWDPDDSRFELRLLVQPVHRYSDPRQSILDGAAFVLAHGTNPEVLLLVEAHGAAPEGAQWRYCLARLGSAEFHVKLDGREIWKRERTPGVVGSPSDPYWLFVLPTESPSNAAQKRGQKRP